MEVTTEQIEQLEEALQLDTSNIKPSVIENFLETLPERAMGLGIRVVLILIFVTISYFVIKLLRRALKHALEKTSVEKGAVQFLDSFLKIVLWCVVILTILVNCGVDAASVVALLGSAGIAVGLAMQGALSNFVGGILILILKPFRVGDYIIEDTKGNEGIVSEITIFYTHLKTNDNKIAIIPNGILANSSMTNVTGLNERLLIMDFDISYESDLDKAKETIYDTASNCKYINFKDSIKVYVSDLADFSIKIGLRVNVRASDYLEAKWYMLEQVKKDLDNAGIKIPYNQLEVHIKAPDKA